ncbi:insulinase family protein [bacterium]|nr:insulinase family protein [bacterium]
MERIKRNREPASFAESNELGYAYSLPFTGSGYEETVAEISRNDLVKFHRTWFKPNNATLVVVGATSMNEIKPKLEKFCKTGSAAKFRKRTLA